jgi:hypothetical protein
MVEVREVLRLWLIPWGRRNGHARAGYVWRIAAPMLAPLLNLPPLGAQVVKQLLQVVHLTGTLGPDL